MRAGVRRVLDREEGFLGTGLSPATDGYAGVVLVTTSDRAAARRAPAEYKGIPVRVQVSGS